MHSKKGYVSITTCMQEKRAQLHASPRYLLFTLVHNLQLKRLLGNGTIQLSLNFLNFIQFITFNIRVFIEDRTNSNYPTAFSTYDKFWSLLNFKFVYRVSPLANAVLLLSMSILCTIVFIFLARICKKQDIKYQKSKQNLLKLVQYLLLSNPGLSTSYFSISSICQSSMC